MTACRRYEDEGLLLDELGQELPEHFSTCPDCRAARAKYRKLRDSLADLGAADEPAADWQNQVRQRIHRREAPLPFPRNRSFGPTLMAVAAVLVAGLALALHWTSRVSPPLPPPAAAKLDLEVRVEAGATSFRGLGEAQPGDLLVLSATHDPAKTLELRLYLNDRALVARCGWPEAVPVCLEEQGTVRLRVPLEAVGRYQPAAFSALEGLPEPSADLDADASAAFASGAVVKLGDEIVVR